MTEAFEGKTMKQKKIYGTGNLYLTPLERVVLDNHSGETFGDSDILLASYEELTQGIKLEKIIGRWVDEKK